MSPARVEADSLPSTSPICRGPPSDRTLHEPVTRPSCTSPAPVKMSASPRISCTRTSPRFVSYLYELLTTCRIVPRGGLPAAGETSAGLRVVDRPRSERIPAIGTPCPRSWTVPISVEVVIVGPPGAFRLARKAGPMNVPRAGRFVRTSPLIVSATQRRSAFGATTAVTLPLTLVISTFARGRALL